MTDVRMIATGISLMALFMAHCRSTGPLTRKPGEEVSQVSTISVTAPDRNQFNPQVRDKFNGYRITVEPVDPNCQKATRVDQSSALTQASLSASLVQGCDYLLGVEFGTLNAAANGLAKILFTNVTGPRTGLTIKQSDIAGKTDLAVTVTVKITQAGIDEGFSKPGNIQINPPTNGSVIINATIEGPGGGGGATGTPVPTVVPTTIVPSGFAAIRNDSQTACVPCHAQASDESWWRSNAVGIKSRLNSTNSSFVMPKPGTPQAATFGSDAKQRMMNFLQ